MSDDNKYIVEDLTVYKSRDKQYAVRVDKYVTQITNKAEFVIWGKGKEYSVLFIPIDVEDNKGWNYIINGKLYTSLLTNSREHLVKYWTEKDEKKYQKEKNKAEQLSLF